MELAGTEICGLGGNVGHAILTRVLGRFAITEMLAVFICILSLFPQPSQLLCFKTKPNSHDLELMGGTPLPQWKPQPAGCCCG